MTTAVLLAAGFAAGLQRSEAAVFTVSNLNDAGAGSLRQAITDANAAGAGPHTIQFSVSGTVLLASELPFITNAGITIDGGNNITISANVGDVDRDVLKLGAGANNTVIRNLILQNTGGEGIYINGALDGVTIENVTIGNTANYYINHGIFVGAATTNMTITNLTINSVQDNYWGIRFNPSAPVNGLVIDGYTITNGGGGSSRSIQLEAAAQNVTIRNSTIDMDDPGSTDDGDYGIILREVDGLVLDNVTINDAEAIGLYIPFTASNVSMVNCTFDNTDGYENSQAIRIHGMVTNMTVDSMNIFMDKAGGTDDGTHGIIFTAGLRDFTMRHTTINDVEGYGWYASGAVVENILIEDCSFGNAEGGGVTHGIRFNSPATNVTIRNVNIDMDQAGNANDGDIGIYFASSVNGLTVRNVTVHDAEYHALYVTQAATNVSVENCTFDNFDGSTIAQLVRFNSTATHVTLDSLTLNNDVAANTTDEGDIGLVFYGYVNDASVTNCYFNRAHARGIHIQADADSLFISNNTFDRNGVGGSYHGGIQFVSLTNATSDGGPVRITGNTFAHNGGAAILVASGADYTLPDFIISQNTIHGTTANQGSIRVHRIDGVQIIQNSIYNIQRVGIDHVATGNCGYEGTNRPLILSSTWTGGNSYDLQISLPSICASGCDVEIFVTDASAQGVGGQYYITTLTGMLSGTSTHTITSSVPPLTSAPWGFWTATLRVSGGNGCGTSEFSNKTAARVNGPAGIDAGVQLWLLPNFVDSGDVVTGTGWADFSGNYRDFDIVAGDPTRVTGGLNFNHTLNFDGDDYLRATNSPFVTSFIGAEVFTVNKASTSACSCGAPYDFGGSSNSHYPWTTGHIYNDFGTTQRLGWHPTTQAIVQSKTGVSAITGSPLNVTDWNLYGTYSATGNWSTLFNGESVAATTTNTMNFGLVAGNERVGAGGATTFNGDIAEVILYNRVLTTPERERINTYLGIKYGLTLKHNYIASDGTTTWWSIAGNNGYNHDITGMARDNLSILHQNQSRSANSDNMVTMGVGSALDSTVYTNPNAIANNLSALMWGNNDSSTAFTVPLANPNYNVRMVRVWKVDKTNWSDTLVNMVVKDGNGSIALVISTDPTFATVNQTISLSDSGTVILNSSLLQDGSYFTFARRNVAPACIVSGITGWYRADDINSVTSNWRDYSENDNHALQSTGTNQPVKQMGAANFHPAFDFDGIDDYMDIAGNLGLNGTNNFTVFSVGKRESVGTADAFLGQQGIVNNNFLTYYRAANNYAVESTGVGTISSTGIYSAPNILRLHATTRSGNNFSLFTNGAADGTGTGAYNFTTNNLRIGNRDVSSDAAFDGDISEIIVYNRQLNPTELQQVNSYLALKYGITYDNGVTDYLSSSTLIKMWDATVNASYNNNITGIGRDSCSSLHQKQSRSVNAGGLVTVALGNQIETDNSQNASVVTNNLSFLVFGDNAGATTFDEPVNGSQVSVRMDRVWKVDKTNWGDQNIVLKLHGDANSTYLLISNSDPAFGTIDQEIALAGDSTVQMSSALLPDGAYFTFGKRINGPGNVDPNVVLWLRSDAGTSTTTNNTPVATWNDQSSGTNNASQVTGADQPVYSDNATDNMNFNPVLKFNGVSQHMLLDGTLLPLGNSARTVLAVTGNAGSIERGVISWGSTGAVTSGRRYTLEVGGGWYAVETSANRFGANLGNTVTPSIAGLSNTAGSTFSATQIRVNGTGYPSTLLCCGANNFLVDTEPLTTAYVGRSTYFTGNTHFNGSLSEVVVYNRVLTAGEQQRVESYLAIKYGITLNNGATNYLASDSTVIWDATVNAGYSHDITGIGRDDNSGLNQKQSASVNSDNLITLGVGTSLAATNLANAGTMDDMEFFTWGNDNGGTTFTVGVSGLPNATMRMGRVWKADKTNWVDRDITIGVQQTGERYLLIDSDDDSFDAGTTSEYAFDINTGTVTINSSAIPDGAYFTIATRITGPACVTAGIQTWLRSDYGASGSNWVDFSGNQQNATQLTAANQPTLSATLLNFNPAMEFDGTSDGMGINLNINPSVNDTVTVYTVYHADATGTNRGLWGNDDANFDRHLMMHGYSNGGATSLYTGGNVANTNLIVGAQMDEGTANGSFVWVNGTQAANFTQSGSEGGTPTMVLGSITTALSSTWFDGKIAEFVIYDRVLTATEKQQVESYLALRYGITLGNGTVNYLSGSGAVIWDAATNSAYNDDITGVGVDSCGTLIQKQSKSANTDDIITIGIQNMIASSNQAHTGAFASDLSYLVWGNDDGSYTEIATDMPPSFNVFCRRLTREWKVDKTGPVDGVMVTADLNSITITASSAANIKLIVDNDGDGDFNTGTIQIIDCISYTGGIATFDNVTFPDGAVFTIGSYVDLRLRLTAKVYLQGPWNGSAMNTMLKTQGLLPPSDPFGTGSTPSVSPNAASANVVDWVLVELRDPLSPATVISSRAALLLDNGDIVDTNYTQPLMFDNVPPGNYRVAVRHRNHLGIMTLNNVNLSNGTATIDLTNGSTATYGTHALRQLSPGVWGMWAGNTNNDRHIRNSTRPSDVSEVVITVASDPGNPTGSAGYTGVINVYDVRDVNLDGRVYNQAAPSDAGVITNNVATHPGNVFGLASYAIVEQLP